MQKHFNEIQLKIRQLAVAVMVASSTAAGWILKEGVGVSLGPIEFSAASGVFAVTALAMALFGLMDGLWYHRLLKGAGIYAGEQENLLGLDLVGSGLSKTITANSTVYLKRWNLNSTVKLWLFYGTTIAVFVVAAVAAWTRLLPSHPLNRFPSPATPRPRPSGKSRGRIPT